MFNRKYLKVMALITASALALSLAACSTTTEDTIAETTTEVTTEVKETTAEETTSESPAAIDQITNSADGEHAIEADGETVEYSDVKVTKTGDSDSGDEADFYGENSAVFATNGATLTLSNIEVDTDGTHANAVFSYGEGTTVNISDSTITTSGNCSGGLMTTGGGTMNASDLTIHTSGNSSAAIRSDRGGGTVTVEGGSYTTDGTGSPAIYSTADITVSNATLESTASQGVVVEGKNSVTLNNVDLIADNNTKNSDKSDYYQAVMIYQSMSGDAAEGLAEFTMNGGTLTNENGDVFFVNNTVTDISLSGVTVTNNDPDGAFLRAAAAGWGSSGSNGGKVNLTLDSQTLDGDIIVDDVSALNMYLKGGTSYGGAINNADEGEVYVEIGSGSKWTLTDDSHIDALTCDTDGIDLNGHKLYVNGVEYKEGTASEGEAIEMKVESTGMSGAPDGMPSGEKPEGEPPTGSESDRPERPDGEMPGEPPEGFDSDSDRPEPPTGDERGTPPDKDDSDRPEPPADGKGGPNGDGSEPPAKPEDN